MYLMWTGIGQVHSFCYLQPVNVKIDHCFISFLFLTHKSVAYNRRSFWRARQRVETRTQKATGSTLRISISTHIGFSPLWLQVEPRTNTTQTQNGGVELWGILHEIHLIPFQHHIFREYHNINCFHRHWLRLFYTKSHQIVLEFFSMSCTRITHGTNWSQACLTIKLSRVKPDESSFCFASTKVRQSFFWSGQGEKQHQVLSPRSRDIQPFWNFFRVWRRTPEIGAELDENNDAKPFLWFCRVLTVLSTEGNTNLDNSAS